METVTNDMSMTTIAMVVAAFIIVALGGYIIGTRARPKGITCDVDHHWWFGWWVRCQGDCNAGKTCTLLWRMKNTEETWTDAGVVPGGSVKWSKTMEYRCTCR